MAYQSFMWATQCREKDYSQPPPCPLALVYTLGDCISSLCPFENFYDQDPGRAKPLKLDVVVTRRDVRFAMAETLRII
jgi:hypothetical protein